MRYEYDVRTLGLGTDFAAALNGYAGDGWRVVSTLLVPARSPIESGGGAVMALMVVLEREVSANRRRHACTLREWLERDAAALSPDYPEYIDITDKSPMLYGVGAWGWSRQLAIDEDYSDTLPKSLADGLPDDFFSARFDSAAQARQALSDTLIMWADEGLWS